MHVQICVTPNVPPRGRRRWWVGALVALILTALSPATASAAPFLRGFADRALTSSDSSVREHWFDESARAHANLIRINVDWRSHVGGQPADPTNPLDPSYKGFETIDAAVREATQRGLAVSFLVTRAPDWAEGADRPSSAPEGSWKPDPAAFEEFSTALARRYSGTFVTTAGIVPRVEYYQAWGEPNLSDHITPQWVGSSAHPEPFAPERYRELLNALYRGVKGVDPSAKVIAGGTGPFGEVPGGTRMRPLYFLRELLCLRDRKKLKPKSCSAPPRFDILSHHPISFLEPPTQSAFHPDDAVVPDFKGVVRLMRAAERGGTVEGGRHPVWATELWWETNPPDAKNGVSRSKQARWLQDSFYSLWRQGAEAVIWAQIVDEPVGPDGSSQFQTGLFDAAGNEKPSFRAFRFPFVADRVSKKKARVWTIPPASGELNVEKEVKGSWRPVETASVTADQPIELKMKLDGSPRLRAALNGERTLTDKLKK